MGDWCHCGKWVAATEPCCPAPPSVHELRAEIRRLRGVLLDSWLYEATWSNEPDDPSVYSDGWQCAGCFDVDGWGPPTADTKDDVQHHATCPIFSGLPSLRQGNEP